MRAIVARWGLFHRATEGSAFIELIIRNDREMNHENREPRKR